MALLGGPAGRAQRVHPRDAAVEALEPVRQLPQRHRGGPRRRHLDGQRQPVEPPNDPPRGLGLVPADGPLGAHRPHPLGQQAHRHRLPRQRGVRRGRQRLDRPGVLAVDAEALAAGGEDPDARPARDQRLHDGGGLVEDVLAVVEDDEQVERAGPGQGLGGAAVLDRQAQGVGHRPGDGARLGEAAQRDEPRPGLVDDARHPATASDSRVCHAARADQRHDTVLGEQPVDGGDVVVPPDQRRRRDRQRPGRDGRGPPANASASARRSASPGTSPAPASVATARW